MRTNINIDYRNIFSLSFATGCRGRCLYDGQEYSILMCSIKKLRIYKAPDISRPFSLFMSGVLVLNLFSPVLFSCSPVSRRNCDLCTAADISALLLSSFPCDDLSLCFFIIQDDLIHRRHPDTAGTRILDADDRSSDHSIHL